MEALKATRHGLSADQGVCVLCPLCPVLEAFRVRSVLSDLAAGPWGGVACRRSHSSKGLYGSCCEHSGLCER